MKENIASQWWQLWNEGKYHITVVGAVEWKKISHHTGGSLSGMFNFPAYNINSNFQQKERSKHEKADKLRMVTQNSKILTNINKNNNKGKLMKSSTLAFSLVYIYFFLLIRKYYEGLITVGLKYFRYISQIQGAEKKALVTMGFITNTGFCLIIFMTLLRIIIFS